MDISEKKYILAIDQGTTSSRAVIFDYSGQIKHIAQTPIAQVYPNPGWVEESPDEIWETQLRMCRACLKESGVSSLDIAAIGIANQRETTIAWDRLSGAPIYNAIVWQDRRTADFCTSLEEKGLSALISSKTGLVIDPYFSASKIWWMLHNVEGSNQAAKSGDLLVGTVDSWLIWNLTGGRVHATDYTNASRTMLANIHTSDWDDDLLGLFDIPKHILPEIKPSSGFIGVTDKKWFGNEIPICGVSGDQQAALFGQKCVHPGNIKTTYGTGCFILMSTGEKPVVSDGGLLTSLAAGTTAKPGYVLEGSVFNGGSTVQWLRDELQIISSSADIESLALEVNDSGGLVFVPAFTGLGAPLWDPYARGLLIGINRGTSKAHVARAALEGIAQQCVDVIEYMEKDSGIAVKEMKVDGGASVNNLLMQVQSDISGIPILRPSMVETTALGAAFLAGLGAGFWKDVGSIGNADNQFDTFYPQGSEVARRSMRESWTKAVHRSRTWVDA